ncbi:hypothetical protein F5B22DRAFT_410376 [Xylaria bambusicola]|uniref:uncharacterized protein n=1 Tax=Xylaria bambusicola TaxID=326684 RepID=UPI0020086311|nr:uncharacterized protein F5B22DRAFT_410376 [Xylaria bambusicola]KAI0523698.1 hypothetical protein F5B22DRAFT_410376 [Xylaria bambusicola]
MADAGLLMNKEPLIMGMTPGDYQAAFSYLDHANFAREVEAHEAQKQQLGKRPPAAPKDIPWWRRPEYWALILGCVTFFHSLFSTWAWPWVRRYLEEDSPYS